MLRHFRYLGMMLAIALTVTALCPTERARAYPDEPYSLDEASDGVRTKRIHLLGELAFFFGDFVPEDQGAQGADIVTISPLFAARIQFTQNWILETKWGFAFARTELNNNKERSFRVGNPYASIHYQGSGDELSYRVGLGVTAPVATLPENLQENFAAVATYQYARAMRGMWELWLWEPNALAFVIPVRLESAKPSGFLWGVELDLAAMLTFKTNDNPPFVLGMAGDVAYQATNLLRVGSRFSLVVAPKRDLPNSVVSENTQLAAEPYVRIGRENSFFAVRMLINLDRPYGFGFDKGKIWAIRTAGGFAF